MTRLTDKFRLAFAVRFGAMPALATGLTRILRVNCDNPNPCRFRLVVNNFSELRERPVCVSVALRLFNPRPRSNAFKGFNSDTSFRALRRSNKSFADDVVLMRLIAALLAAYLSQFALRRTAADLLQILAAFIVTLAMCFYLSAAIGLPVTVSGKVDDASASSTSCGVGSSTLQTASTKKLPWR